MARSRPCDASLVIARHRTGGGLLRFLLDLEGELRVDVPAVVAGAVGELGGAALGAADVVDRLQRVVGTALALAGLADLLYGLHDELLGRTPARPAGSCATAVALTGCPSKLRCLPCQK